MEAIIQALAEARGHLAAAGYEHAAEAIGNALAFIAAKDERDLDPTAHAAPAGYAPSISQED